MLAFTTSSSFVLASTEISDDFHFTSFKRTKVRTFSDDGFVGNGKIGIIGSTKALNHAENIIESTEGLWITFDFDSPQHNALALEGISGPGDSGGLEIHPLSGLAKDLGSAAVMISLIVASSVWLIILI